MPEKREKVGFNRNISVENEFRCDNIFMYPRKKPYLETTQGGKWGRGKDDSPVNKDEVPSINNPLPY